MVSVSNAMNCLPFTLVTHAGPSGAYRLHDIARKFIESFETVIGIADQFHLCLIQVVPHRLPISDPFVPPNNLQYAVRSVEFAYAGSRTFLPGCWAGLSEIKFIFKPSGSEFTRAFTHALRCAVVNFIDKILSSTTKLGAPVMMATLLLRIKLLFYWNLRKNSL